GERVLRACVGVASDAVLRDGRCVFVCVAPQARCTALASMCPLQGRSTSHSIPMKHFAAAIPAWNAALRQ
ncbi:hypothetical protein, partial [Xanthomonas oryzae]|uniref:hypothetical protein n=4 Tax=Xanthomonas oryzae TaxID=347 RepID=UPI001C67A764